HRAFEERHYPRLRVPRPPKNLIARARRRHQSQHRRARIESVPTRYQRVPDPGQPRPRFAQVYSSAVSTLSRQRSTDSEDSTLQTFREERKFLEGRGCPDLDIWAGPGRDFPASMAFDREGAARDWWPGWHSTGDGPNGYEQHGAHQRR